MSIQRARDLVPMVAPLATGVVMGRGLLLLELGLCISVNGEVYEPYKVVATSMQESWHYKKGL